MKRARFLRIVPVFAAAALCQCETMETSGSSAASEVGGTITVQGTKFYPDGVGTTYIVPAGAQIIGAGGRNCRFLIQEGGSITVHSGENNEYRVKGGGHFRGFAHPAKDCTVHVEPGALIEVEETGPGTRFIQS